MKGPITDEELLAYLLGDADPLISLKIERSLAKDPKLAERLIFVGRLKKEFKTLDEAQGQRIFQFSRRHGPRSPQLARLVALSLAFFILGFSLGKFPFLKKDGQHLGEKSEVQVLVKEENVGLGHERPMNVL